MISNHFPHFSVIFPDMDASNIVGLQTEYMNELLMRLCEHADIEIGDLEIISKQVRNNWDF